MKKFIILLSLVASNAIADDSQKVDWGGNRYAWSGIGGVAAGVTLTILGETRARRASTALFKFDPILLKMSAEARKWTEHDANPHRWLPEVRRATRRLDDHQIKLAFMEGNKNPPPGYAQQIAHQKQVIEDLQREANAYTFPADHAKEMRRVARERAGLTRVQAKYAVRTGEITNLQRLGHTEAKLVLGYAREYRSAMKSSRLLKGFGYSGALGGLASSIYYVYDDIKMSEQENRYRESKETNEFSASAN